MDHDEHVEEENGGNSADHEQTCKLGSMAVEVQLMVRNAGERN